MTGGSLEQQIAALIHAYAPQLRKATPRGPYVEDGDYDRFKYALAKIIAQHLRRLPCVEKIYYADLASGEFISQQPYYGRDLDLLVVTRGCTGTAEGLARRLEQETNDAVARHARAEGLQWLAHIAETNGVLEIHVDDRYALTAYHNEQKGTLSDTNAIPLA